MQHDTVVISHDTDYVTEPQLHFYFSDAECFTNRE